MIKDQIAALVTELFAARGEYHQLALDEPAPDVLGPPSSPRQLFELERMLGKHLPPSYRALMELHHGWESFDGDANILSNADRKADWFGPRVQELGGMFMEFTGENPLASWGFPVILGPGAASNQLTVLDTRQLAAGGEIELTRYDFTNEERRFPSWLEYLQAKLDVTRKLIEMERNGTED